MNIRGLIQYGVIFVMVAFSSGCSVVTTYEFPLNAHTDYPASTIKKFNSSVALVITDGLKNAEINTKLVGGGDRVLIGRLLEKNSVALANSLFNSVKVVGDRQAAMQEGTDAILVPTLVGQYRDTRKHQTASADLEWEFSDSKGNVLWVDTINGKGSADVKTFSLNVHKEFNDRAKKQVTLLMQDLFDSSFISMYNSQEIKEFTNGK